MRVALLSSGPSLNHFDPSVSYDMRIGVNQAACAHACDWWSAGDEQTIFRHLLEGPLVKGDPSICTMTPASDRIRDRCPDRQFRIIRWEQLRDAQNPPQQWDTWSCTAALVLAVHLGATCIDVHGVDMSGPSDFTGASYSRFHANRWKRERPVWETLVSWARGRGVRVHWPQESRVVQACA